MQCGQKDMEGGQHPTHQGKTAQGGHLLQHPVHIFVISLNWLIYNMHNIIPKLNLSLWRLEVWQLGQCISLGSMELIWLDWVMVQPPALPSNARLGPCLAQVMWHVHIVLLPKFYHYLLIFMSLNTCMLMFVLCNTKEEIFKNLPSTVFYINKYRFFFSLENKM